MEHEQNLGFVIEQLMKKKGVTQKQLCRDLSINEGALISMKKNNKFKTNTLRSILTYLGESNFDKYVLGESKSEVNKSFETNGVGSFDSIINYLKEIINQKDELIIKLATENGSLMKELGKYSGVTLA